MRNSPLLSFGYSVHKQSDGTFVVQHPKGHFLVDGCHNTRRFANCALAVNAARYDAKRNKGA